MLKLKTGLKSKLPTRLKSKLIGSKYGNKPINGFDSTSEYHRWCFLCALEKSGEIYNLRHHVLYKFNDGTGYEADFVYMKDGKKVVEDVKSPALRYGYKFIANKRKMKHHFNLDVFAIHPQTKKIY